MNEFKLAAGSVVKFGTLSTQLYPLLRNGVSDTDAKGIMIGELMASFSAARQFFENTSQVHQAHEAIMGRFVQALQEQRGEKPQLPELEAISLTAGIPVVLEIVLGEDCLLSADTHFVADGEVEKSWKLWRSGYLHHANGIPPSWIRQFYFPRLLDYRDVNTARSQRSMEQTTDAALMIGGLMQFWHKDTPADLLNAFKKQYGRINFSQNLPFDETSLERFFNLNAMIDPATRLLNQMTLWQDMDALAKKQGIALSQL
jgi:hypothetical protein